MENVKNRTPLIVLGSTGSVGTQALDVAERTGTPVEAICAHRDVAKVEEQARRFGVKACAMGDEAAAADLRVRLADTSVRVYGGEDGIPDMIADSSAPIALNAIIGEAGLASTLAVLKADKQLALANKESLVVAGDIVMKTARERGIAIRPVDSEHCAIAQALMAGESREVKRLILTASGGPFFGKTRAELEGITKEQALKHPNWSMGAKITIDSATLMNKGLEIIEAKWLFDVDIEDIEVVVHRESIIHSMVEYKDLSVIAQLSLPSMKHPIQYAFTYPERLPSPDKRLSLKEIGKLTFFEPDEDTFRCLALAKKAGKMGGIMPTVLNAANEVAVNAFLRDKIRFLEIADFVEGIMEKFQNRLNPTLEDIINVDKSIRLEYGI